MEKYNIKFEDYKDSLRAVYPLLSNEQLEDIFEVRVAFWKTIIE